MGRLFSIAELVEITQGQAQNVSASHITGISIDSRTLEPGALFVAIRGENFDGHQFVENAISNGAALALIRADKAQALINLPHIAVPDPLAALGRIAKAARARSRAKIVAITGSAGKTTSKEAVRAILELAGPTHASIKSYNNHWGVPLMLAGLPPNADFGVFEVGMNHFGEITPLAKLVKPHVALITNVGTAHLGNFDSEVEIARAKAEIFAGLERGGVVILNADHEYLPLLKDLAKAAGVERIMSYGFSPGADICIINPKTSFAGSSAEVVLENTKVRLELKVPGRHMLANAVGALCVGEQLGVETATSLRALASFTAPEGRGRVYRFGTQGRPLVLIDESYNANPASMVAALEVFQEQLNPYGRKILVLGDMFELGEKATEMHALLAGPINRAQPDVVYAIGDNMPDVAALLNADILVAGEANNIEQIEREIVNGLDQGDLIMVKGSNGVRLGHLVEAIRGRFAGGE